jgi:hypothetical protein
VQTVSGEIERFIEDPRGAMHGFVLDGGQVVRFPVEKAPGVARIVSVGSHVGIEGILHSDGSSQEYWEPFLIMNFDSKRSVTFLAPNSQARPGMLPHNPPQPEASLVHPEIPRTTSESEGAADSEHFSRNTLGDSPSAARTAPAATRDDAVTSISQSYDALHRVQAILAYLHIMKRGVSGIGQLLDEAKHTYVQALSRYDSRSFVAASEFASASAGLARVVGILISRTVRSDFSLPSLVPRPPDSPLHATDSGDIEKNLTEAQSILSRVHWLLENGTLPLDDRTQVRRIASWGDAFYHQAQRYHRNHRRESPRDASELAQAAVAAAHSAEHICRKWYVDPAVVTSKESSELLRTLLHNKK